MLIWRLWATYIHSFITSIYIAPLQVGLLRGAHADILVTEGFLLF